jgi:hypothetical protein
MKNLALFITVLFLGGTTVQATTTSSKITTLKSTYVSGYGNSFIFVEDGIEFSVFPDGQFDFYMPKHGPNVSLGYSSPNVSISFNSGYNYNPYVQYDDFGAIIQIENIPIYYDYYGRITRAGNVNIRYNNYGRVVWVGGLHIYYRNNVFSHYTGYINAYNRYYVYRPWHGYYTVPVYNYCVVNTLPYRQYYAPVRYTYYRPYTNNYRNVNINSRRGVAQTGRYTQQSSISERYRQEAQPRRESYRNINTQVNRNSRATNSAGNTSIRREVVSNQRDNMVRKEIKSTPRVNNAQENKMNNRVAENKRNVNKSTNYSTRKPNIQNQRISSNERNKNTQQVTQNKNRLSSVSKSNNSRTNVKSSRPDSKRKKI